jgi:hypothetical protein
MMGGGKGGIVPSTPLRMTGVYWVFDPSLRLRSVQAKSAQDDIDNVEIIDELVSFRKAATLRNLSLFVGFWWEKIPPFSSG